MITVYLGGTFPKNNQELYEKYTEKHNILKHRLEELGYKVLSPLRGKVIGSGWDPNEIVHRDERDIDNSDIMLVLMTEPSIGSSMEIYRAREICGIPVIVVTDCFDVYNHYWIRAKVTKIFLSVSEAVDYIGWLIY